MKTLLASACPWILCLCCLAGPLHSENTPAIHWEEAVDLPEPRDAYAAGIIGGRLFIIGGAYWEGTKGDWRRKVFTGTTHAFDPGTRRWEKLADTAVTFGYPAAAQVGEEIFIIGGNQNGRPGRGVFVFRWDGQRYGCERHSELPETRLFANAVAVGTKIYVIGGTREYEPFDDKGTCCTSKTATTTLWALDTTDPTRTWRSLASYPGEARWLQSAAAVGTDIYVFGGICLLKQHEPARQLNDMLHYDTLTGKWRRVGVMPPTMQSATAVRIGNQVVLLGPQQQAMAFDPRSGAFTPMDPLPRDAMVTAFVWIDPFLVGAGGENTLDGPRRRSPWTFLGRPGAHWLARARE